MSKKAPKKKLKDVIKKNKIVDVFLGFIGKDEKLKKKLHESDDNPFHDVDDLHLKLSGHYNFHSYHDSHLSKAIRRYTGSMANIVNARKLHQRGIKNPKAEYPKYMRQRADWEDINKHEKNLSAALKKHTAPVDFHVHTGMTFSPEHHAGAEFRMPAWTSTSLDHHRAGMFARPIEGSKYTYARNIFNSNDVKQVSPAAVAAHEKKREIARKVMEKHENWEKFRKAENTHGYYPAVPGYKPASIGGDPNHPKAGWTTGDKELDKHVHNLHLHQTGTTTVTPYKHVMKIHIPKGAHGAYIADHSDFPEEKEFLLHHGAKVRVHHEPEIDHENKKVIWNAKLSHDGIKPTKFADFSKMRRPTIDKPPIGKHGQLSLFERRMIHNVIQRMLAR